MLEKVERTARTHYSAQFRKGKTRIGDRAQRERRKGPITAGIAKGDGLAVEAYLLTGIDEAEIRRAASRRATWAGSTAKTISTVDG